jgi:hypothetical protein
MFKPSTRLLATVGAVLMAGAIALPASTSWASRGDCSQPATGGANPVATDCLFILRAAVGSSTCTESCICDTSGDLRVSATDALICLLDTVGATVDLNCPCGGRVDLQDDDYLFDADVDVVDADIRSRFVDTNYIGAFPQDEDPATGDWTVGWTISLHGNKTVWEPASGGTLAGGVPSADGSCPAGTTDIGDTALPAGFAGTMDICQLAARYDTDSQTITLTNDNVYRLGGTASQGTLIGDGDAEDVVPGTAAHVTLTIEPGTLILGTSAEALAITRGSDIFVNGTADDPVVMSSVTWFNDWLAGSDGTSGFGEWGGLVVTGFGTANQCNDVVSCDALVEGYLNPFNYGGLDNSDDSGSISYLVIRQGGFDLDGNGSELNGLTLYTVGYNTEISYVQVHQNDDDGIEFFGGKVVVDHAVVTETGDDSLDTDLGFGGGVQFAVVKQGRTAADRGMETDSSRTPRTRRSPSRPGPTSPFSATRAAPTTARRASSCARRRAVSSGTASSRARPAPASVWTTAPCPRAAGPWATPTTVSSRFTTTWSAATPTSKAKTVWAATKTPMSRPGTSPTRTTGPSIPVSVRPATRPRPISSDRSSPSTRAI